MIFFNFLLFLALLLYSHHYPYFGITFNRRFTLKKNQNKLIQWNDFVNLGKNFI